MPRDESKDETWFDVRILRRRVASKQITEPELAEYLSEVQDCGNDVEWSTSRMQYTGTRSGR